VPQCVTWTKEQTWEEKHTVLLVYRAGIPDFIIKGGRSDFVKSLRNKFEDGFKEQVIFKIFPSKYI
jgi:hypothetical protein